jgi:hypothetical protein
VAYGWIEGHDYSVLVPEVATFRFRPGGDELSAFPATGGSENMVTDAYRTIALPLALHVSGFEALHASAVDFEGVVVAFCALSETGKTTTAYALSRRGFPLWADDAVVFEAHSDTAPVAHQIPFSANLRSEIRKFFALGDRVPSPSEESGADPLPLGAVMLLERSEEIDAPHVDIRRLAPAEAIPLLVPHSQRFDLGNYEHRRRTVQNYLELVGHVPVLQARFVPGLDKLDAMLTEVERGLRDVIDRPT